MQEFDLWKIDDEGGLIATEVLEVHPEGLEHAVRIKSTSEETAILAYRSYCSVSNPDADWEIRDQDEFSELTGRMYESIDLQLAIESGQFKTVDEIAIVLRQRSYAIQKRIQSFRAE
ncbi:hypothetical protein HFM15_002759 [Vibrio cholerae]|nr:hypothetical protein [Vibrio cholerae]